MLAALAAAAPAGADVRPPTEARFSVKLAAQDVRQGEPTRCTSSETRSPPRSRSSQTGSGVPRREPARRRPLPAEYPSAGAPTVVRAGNGRLLQMTWTWHLRCLTVECLPVTKHSDLSHVFQFSPAHLEYLSPTGQVRYTLDARFQRRAVLFQLSPSEVAAIDVHALVWSGVGRIHPAPAAGALGCPRTSPSGSPSRSRQCSERQASLSSHAGPCRTSRPGLRRRLPGRRRSSARSRSSSGRGRTTTKPCSGRRSSGSPTSFPFDVHDLSETARALAWSPETPEEEDVQEISEKAGIQRRNGEPER